VGSEMCIRDSIMIWLRGLRGKAQFNKIDWLAVFLSLFWLRQVANLLVGFGMALWTGMPYYFGGDEYYISVMMGLHDGTIGLVTGFLGFLVAVFVVFYTVPRHLRFSFILAGFVGSTLGYIGWLHWLGPVLIP